MSDFSETPLREHRENVLFETLDVVAGRAGYTKMALSYIERGTSFPRISSFKKLAKAYRLSPKRLKEMLKGGVA